MDKTLSKEYRFLRFFQGLIGLSIFIYTSILLVTLPEQSFTVKGNSTLLIVTTVSYLLFLFYSICIISIVNFLFKLDETKNNLEGLKTSWHSNGQKKREYIYKDGEKDGLSTSWYENGEKLKEGTYKNGNEDGLWTYWYENGEKKQERTFKDGELDGLYKRWYRNGQKSSEGTYKDGIYISERRWNEDGSVKK